MRELEHASAARCARIYSEQGDLVAEGEAMMWILIAVGVLMVGGIGAFLFAPTLKSFFGPDFEPAPKDPASVDNAIMTRMVDGGSGGM
jgi:hypothetical protein